jgi:cytochrome c oxidase cbb3-type subunit I
MVPASPPVSSPAGGTSSVIVRAELGAIDASTRAPVLLFLVFGVLWLLAATALAIVSSVQLHNPGFLGEYGWLTYGRARPAYLSGFIYGWAFNAAFAVALWLMARLSGAVVRGGAMAIIGGLFWNLGVALGVVGILIGDGTGYAWLDMPRYVAPILFAAYALIGAVTVATFRFSRFSSAYVSQWYLLAALFWFPWIYTVGQAMLIFGEPRGVVQAILQAWFEGNLYGLWLAPIALAAIYYFLPKLVGRPIRDYRIARMGFWTWGLFATWAGARHLIGGPVPAWVQATGAAASLMLLVPVVVIGINYFGTLSGHYRKLRGSPTLSFLTVSAAAFVLAGVAMALTSLRSVAEVTQFTYVGHALLQLELYAFFSMAVFGSVYYLLPRLLHSEWPSGALIKAHYWSSLTGAGLAIACLLIGGWLQGHAINHVDQFPDYVSVVARTVPYLVGHSLALVLLAVAHLAFAVNVGLMLTKPRAAAVAPEALFRNPPALEVAR